MAYSAALVKRGDKASLALNERLGGVIKNLINTRKVMRFGLIVPILQGILRRKGKTAKTQALSDLILLGFIIVDHFCWFAGTDLVNWEHSRVVKYFHISILFWAAYVIVEVI